MNPDDAIFNARVQLTGTVIELLRFSQWLAANADRIPDPAAKVIAAMLLAIVKYSRISVAIINQPQVEHPVRNLFY